MKKDPALWFSRHAPTAEQVAEIAANDYEIMRVEQGRALGSVSIETEEDAKRVVAELRRLVRDTGAIAIYGVFPAPIMERGADIGVHVLFSAWNVTRAQEGKPPTFHHRRFCRVATWERGTL